MDLQNTTIAELVSQDYRKASVFKKYGMDFCCGGKRPVAEACERKDIDVAQLEKELRNIETHEAAPTEHFQDWDIDFMVDYIVQNHHRYTKRKLPELEEYAQKVAKVHGEANPETKEVNEIVQQMKIDLQMHMQKEEQILFPVVKKLVEADEANLRSEALQIENIDQPIQMMEQEHDDAGEALHRLRDITQGFEPPSHACNTYRVLYAQLKDFEADMHKHIHLENNLLFPQALELKEEFLEKEEA